MDHTPEDAELIAMALEIAENVMLRHGELPPVAFMRTGAEVVVVTPSKLGVKFDGGPSKQAFVGGLNMLSIHRRADAVLFLSEFWTVGLTLKLDAEDWRIWREIDARDGSLQDHPKVEEGVMLMLNTHDGNDVIIRAIKRPQPDVVELVEPPEKPPAARIIGRMTKMLAPRALQDIPDLQQLAAVLFSHMTFERAAPEATP